MCLVDLHEQWNDRSMLGDDIVSRMHKEKYSEGKDRKWTQLTNEFFSGYRTKEQVFEYFKSLGGNCWDIGGEYIGACRITLETAWVGKRSICHSPEFIEPHKDVFIYKFKKVNENFKFEYEQDYASSTKHQLPLKWK